MVTSLLFVGRQHQPALRREETPAPALLGPAPQPLRKKIVTTIASGPSPIRYQVPKSDRNLFSSQKISAPTIGPSMRPMPPIITMKIANAVQFTLNAASGEMRRLPTK